MTPSKKGDIRGFFKPVGPSSSQTRNEPPSSSQARTEPASSPPAASDRFLLSDLLSSPKTPQKSTSRVFNYDDEVKGSDDSGEESDDSLGSITKALGYRSGPAAHQRDPNVLSTPQAKRIASGIHRSPLTLQPKKHKFDMKALMSHSREIERTEESFRKANALIAEAEQNSGNSDNSDAENGPKPLDAASCRLFVGADDEDGKGDKIRRAFKRSKNDDTLSRKHCYFFGPEEPPPVAGKNAFPRKKATGRWKCLSQSDTRRQAFITGLPHTFLTQGLALPDELFQWILDEIWIEQNAELRRQYINLAELCEDNTNRLVDDARLYAALERVGGPRYVRGHGKFEGTTEVRHGYLERNWSLLVTFLQFLDQIASNLQIKSAISAVQLLLRMSMDPIVATVVRNHHTRALATLVSHLAKYQSQWNKACASICSYIYESIDDLELKATVLSSISSSTSHLVDLRRRIAAESLFDMPGLGANPVDPHLSFERICDRLDADDFKPTNRTDFDFERLRALTTLLDIVVDRAAFMHPAARSKADHKTSVPGPGGEAATAAAAAAAAAAAERRFDADVDALAARVKAVHDRIRDKASRKNVKLGLLGLEKRLTYAVRTRPPPKREIFASFDGAPTAAAAAAAREPERQQQQRDFMRQWALKKAERRGGTEKEEEDEPLETDGFADRGRRRRGATKNLQVAVG